MKLLAVILLLQITPLCLRSQVQVNCDHLFLSADTFYLVPSQNTHVIADLHYKDTNMVVYPVLRLLLQDTSIIKTTNNIYLSFLVYPIDSVEQFDFNMHFKTFIFPSPTTVNALFHIYDSDTPGDSLLSCYFPIKLILQHPLSTAETLQQKKELKLFPNPASSTLMLANSGSENININIYDIRGALVKTTTVLKEQKIQLDISTLDCGLYFYKVIHSGGLVDQGKFCIDR